MCTMVKKVPDSLSRALFLALSLALAPLADVSALLVVFTSAATSWGGPEQYSFWHGAWICALVIKTVYCYSWDVLQDWGLLQGGGLLRPTTFFGRDLYVAALAFNFVGRIAWSIAISPAFCEADCTLGLGLLEVVRRCVWLLIRVEWAYIGTLSSPPLLSSSSGK